MSPKSIFTFAILITSMYATAQEEVRKVVRKGVNPVIITKTTSGDRTAYSLNQFKGRWQEVSRMDRQTKNRVEFTDTMFYHFTGTNDVYTKDGVTMSMRGKASIEPGNELIAAADVFDIRSVSQKEIVLDDREKYIHKFTRKRKFWYETLPSNSVTPEKFTIPINAKSSDLVGNWMVYRRDAEPGAANEGYLLRSLNISRAEGSNAYGNVTFFHTDRTDSAACTLTLVGENLHIITNKHSWNFDVYKANGNELVFGTSLIKYYCKQF